MSERVGIKARLDRMLESTVDARSLAVFRIMLGFSVWFEGRENVQRLTQYTPGQFHLRYGLELDWSFETLHAFCEWQMRFAVLVMLGVFTRVFALAAFVCQASLFLVSQLNFRNHVYLMLVLLLLTALSSSDRAWSARHLFEKIRGNASYDWKRAPAFGPRMIQAQILLIYLYSGLHKLLLGFGNGYALCRFLGRELPRGRSGGDLSPDHLAWVAENMSREACSEAAPWIILVGSIGTIVAEIGLAVSLAFRRTAWLAIVVGIGLHVSIYWSMDVVTFGLMMVASYGLFLSSAPGSSFWSAAPLRSEAPSDGQGDGADSGDDASAAAPPSDEAAEESRPAPPEVPKGRRAKRRRRSRGADGKQ